VAPAYTGVNDGEAVTLPPPGWGGTGRRAWAHAGGHLDNIPNACARRQCLDDIARVAPVASNALKIAELAHNYARARHLNGGA